MTKYPDYRGVYVRTEPRPSPYFARLHHKGKWVFSTYSRTPEEAALAYDRLAVSIWGNQAKLNFPVVQ